MADPLISYILVIIIKKKQTASITITYHSTLTLSLRKFTVKCLVKQISSNIALRH